MIGYPYVLKVRAGDGHGKTVGDERRGMAMERGAALEEGEEDGKRRGGWKKRRARERGEIDRRRVRLTLNRRVEGGG